MFRESWNFQRPKVGDVAEEKGLLFVLRPWRGVVWNTSWRREWSSSTPNSKPSGRSSLFSISRNWSSRTPERLDISKEGSANAALLAVSAIINGGLSVGEMTELLSNILDLVLTARRPLDQLQVTQK
jgi:hypothetical protein